LAFAQPSIWSGAYYDASLSQAKVSVAEIKFRPALGLAFLAQGTSYYRLGADAIRRKVSRESVGWVERSETQQSRPAAKAIVGFHCVQPNLRDSICCRGFFHFVRLRYLESSPICDQKYLPSRIKTVRTGMIAQSWQMPIRLFFRMFWFLT
jgi:hypothetical protein